MTSTPIASPAPARRRIGRSTRRVLGWGGALLLMAAAALTGHTLSMRAGLARLAEAAQHRLDLVATGLASDLARFDYLPALLEITPSVAALLDQPDDAALRDQANRQLQRINATAGAANLYVTDTVGRCQAASDWEDPGTPIGADLSFRPYVRDALEHGRGRFYGVGVTSHRAGYYLSYVLMQQGRQRGVATVKVSLEAVEPSWRKLPGEVLLADQRGVVILSTREEWKYRPLAPLSTQVRQELAGSRPYGDAPLVPLAIGHDRYRRSERLLAPVGWRLIVLDELAPVRAGARTMAVTAALASAVLLLIATLALQRQRALRQRLANQAALQAAHDSLEAKVAERTADLRAAQDELVHAGKMAALGQMSAGLVHEMNQPLGAMRTLSDNACLLLEQQRTADVQANLQRIGRMVDRLGRLTGQLKAFAHKAAPALEPVNLQRAIANAQFLIAQRLREQAVELDVSVQPAGLAALAEETRLEQVLVNLMGNAIDAMAAAPPGSPRTLRIEAAAGAAGRCVIRVRDSGPGIRADILARLFEPFVTSKPAGAGLGLGLMISAHLARELGGTLGAHNVDGAGACFVIDLPIPTAPETAAQPAPQAHE
ncbi:histidine kinase [Leptothrix cholodnii SP-6]|uniref:C4-dicarboxylate transport sensor protein DctB n=1 Tax=Leptothrix cholodnii (strain ATCC 51168 / LMG 8142 / SP-6) TaxID=395495 RepID=B1Y0B1_LEPCP|nr:ATP-binding protein [Leptothrix cholodnii]ACB36590.1 histidine kinase [Leptothrix cholodnii SP-6]